MSYNACGWCFISIFQSNSNTNRMWRLAVHMYTIFMLSIVQCECKAQLAKKTTRLCCCCCPAYVSSYTAMVCGENDTFLQQEGIDTYS